MSEEAGGAVASGRRRKSMPSLPSATRTRVWEDKRPLLGAGGVGEGGSKGSISKVSQASIKARKYRGYRLRLYFQVNRCLRGLKQKIKTEASRRRRRRFTWV